MNKIFKIILFFIALSGFACGSDCSIDKPKNLKPIDWEGWNYMYDVYYNSLMECSEAGNNPIFGREIKIYGWINKPSIEDGKSVLVKENEKNYEFGHLTQCMFITAPSDVYIAIIQKLNVSDLSKKCYVKGTLGYICLPPTGSCSTTSTSIYLESVDDIYFE